MNKKLLVACLGCFLVTFAATVETDRINGSCPEFDPMPNYEPKKDDGVWYGIYAADKGKGFEDKPCYKIRHGMVNTDDFLLYIWYKIDDSIEEINKYAQQFTGTGTYMLKGALRTDVVIMTVLDSDYKNYLVWFICSDGDDNTHAYEAIIFSRQRKISDDSLERAKAALNKAGITETLNDITQNNC